ncbi:HNH endonuclease [Nodularia spumigena]
MQKHDKIPCHQGGNDTYANLSLVHYYCHQQIHSHTPDDIYEPGDVLSLW